VEDCFEREATPESIIPRPRRRQSGSEDSDGTAFKYRGDGVGGFNIWAGVARLHEKGPLSVAEQEVVTRTHLEQMLTQQPGIMDELTAAKVVRVGDKMPTMMTSAYKDFGPGVDNRFQLHVCSSEVGSHLYHPEVVAALEAAGFDEKGGVNARMSEWEIDPGLVKHPYNVSCGEYSCASQLAANNPWVENPLHGARYLSIKRRKRGEWVFAVEPPCKGCALFIKKTESEGVGGE